MESQKAEGRRQKQARRHSRLSPHSAFCLLPSAFCILMVLQHSILAVFFVSPGFLVAGALLASIPIIIHFLHPPALQAGDLGGDGIPAQGDETESPAIAFRILVASGRAVSRAGIARSRLARHSDARTRASRRSPAHAAACT